MYPTISIINNATVPLGVDLDALIKAMQVYVNTCLSPFWGKGCKVIKTQDFVPGTWAMTFLNNADVADALGYHDLTPDGLPLAKIFVETTIGAGELVSVTATHELAEMLVDPECNLWASSDTKIYAYENADPVEETHFPINKIPMSNFVFPSWFESYHKPGSVRFDYMRLITQPFQLLAGGYASVVDAGQITQIFGSEEKKQRFAKEDRRHHRSESRMKPRKSSRR